MGLGLAVAHAQSSGQRGALPGFRWRTPSQHLGGGYAISGDAYRWDRQKRKHSLFRRVTLSRLDSRTGITINGPEHQKVFGLVAPLAFDFPFNMSNHSGAVISTGKLLLFWRSTHHHSTSS